MYCPKCGYPIEDEEYCPGCNSQVKELLKNECSVSCFICGEHINAGDKFCRGCGIPDPMVVPLDPEAGGDGTYCWECGAEFIGGRCPNCGLNEEDFKEHINTIATMGCLVCHEKIFIKDKFCHACGSENSFVSSAKTKTKARFCKHCGTEFENGECPICGAKQEEALKYVDYRFCPNCSEFIDEYSKFCPVCGKAAAKKSAEKKSAQKETVRTDSSILWVILGFLQLVVFCNPFGIGTIVCAHKAGKLFDERKIEESDRKLKASKKCFFSGLAFTALIVAAVLIMAMF